ncbi:hypothetical protein ACOTH1_16010 [Achromobacter ruhlandii]|uniref:hypothetical protein n=1 Tax=Achromobacter ruhlandii TaxID=72557 RepID=UPI003B999B03
MSKFYWPPSRATTALGPKTAIFPGTNCSSFVANDLECLAPCSDTSAPRLRATTLIVKFRLKITQETFVSRTSRDPG